MNKQGVIRALQQAHHLVRQIAVTALGRDQPTLFLSNHVQQTRRELIIRYAGRNRAEDGLGISVNFFHLDCLASEVRLNVGLGATLTVVANGCYRWLASRLRGYEKTAPRQVAALQGNSACLGPRRLPTCRFPRRLAL